MFVRSDLSAPQIAVQACHACIDAGKSHLLDSDSTPNLVLLGVKNEKKLLEVSKKLKGLGIKHAQFYEPDVNGFTAIATEIISGVSRRHFKQYQLFKLQPRRSWLAACLGFFVTFFGGK